MSESKSTIDDEWVKYLDEETNAYYWYNNDTGESRWEGEQEGGESSSPLNSTKGKENNVQKKKQKTNKSKDDHDKDKTTNIKKPKNKKSSKRSKKKEYNDDDDEFIDLLREQDLFNRTGVDINRYRLCFYLNLLLLEYPLSVLEGCIRTVLLSLLVVVMLVVSALLCVCCSLNAAKHSLSYMYLVGREVILTMAATLSLVVPFVILFIYRDYDTEHVWDLSPLPTIIGGVDARRFLVVSMGQGSEADNVNIDMTRVTAKTQDRWGMGSTDNMVLFPRVFLKHLLD